MEDQFMDALWLLQGKLKLSTKDFKLLVEAFRRKHLLKAAGVKFYGLGTPIEYKSTLFEVSFPPAVPKSRNWYRLTSLGYQKLAELEKEVVHLLPKESIDREVLNEKLFSY